MCGVILTLVAILGCGVVHASPASPPRISLDLSLNSMGVIRYADRGYANMAVKIPGDGTEEFLAKRCEVMLSNSSTCTLPHATAYDHHEGALRVAEKTLLWVDSPRHRSPIFGAAKPVPTVNYTHRGEYLLFFDAEDSSGNHAETMRFAIIMMDRVAPSIMPAHSKGAKIIVESCDPLQPHMDTSNRRFFVPPLHAVDDYDGDVSETVSVKIQAPAGASYNQVQRHDGSGTYRPVVDTKVLGDYTLFYTAHDYAGIFGVHNQNNVAHRTLQLRVVDTKPPRVYCRSEGYSASGATRLGEATRLQVAPVFTSSMDECANVCFHQQYTSVLPPSNSRVCNAFELRVGQCYLHHAPPCTPGSSSCTPGTMIEKANNGVHMDESGARFALLRQCGIALQHECGLQYVDAGAVCLDLRDSLVGGTDSGKVSALALHVSATGHIDANTPGMYTTTYGCVDSRGRAASTQSRVVHVVDNTAPELKVVGPHVLQVFAEQALESALDALTVDEGSLMVGCHDKCSTGLKPTATLYRGGCAGVHACIDPKTGKDSECDGGELDAVAADTLEHAVGIYGVVYQCTDAVGNRALPACRIIEQVGAAPTPAPTPVPPTPFPTPAPLDCSVSAWSSWSACSETCGAGVQQRWRRETVAAAHGGQSCPPLSGTRDCPDIVPCPIHCEHTWGTWGSCTVTCGSGAQARLAIVRVQAQHGGVRCPIAQQRSCHEAPCPGDCVVGAWGSWGACAATCGAHAVRRRQRAVVSMATHGGKKCPALTMVSSCPGSSALPCPPPLPPCSGRECDCVMTDWSTWGGCTASCGHGTQIRQRVVVAYPRINHRCCAFGRSCGSRRHERQCAATQCPVDCVVGSWEQWGACTSSCTACAQSGNACPHHPTMTRKRALLVSARGGGRCYALSETRRCTVPRCPVHCVVSTWSSWGTCPRSCGGALQERMRIATTSPQYGGRPCPDLSEARVCSSRPCPVDCIVGSWGAFDACSVTCGVGARTRRRGVVHDAAAGGKGCAAVTQVQSCNRVQCRRPCIVSHFGAWTSCVRHLSGHPVQHISCGGGIQMRTRSVLSVDAKEPCPPLTQTRSCKTSKCPHDCIMQSWATWSECDRTCGGGLRVRRRDVASYPAFGGKLCGARMQTSLCNAAECAVDCVLSPWKAWSSCSVSCGTGMHVRTRHIIANPANGGLQCGALLQEKTCDAGPCPVHCVVSAWATWSVCSRSCGSGSQTRARSVVQQPVYPGRVCPALTASRICATHLCPAACATSLWTSWTPCTKTCGGGIQTRHRHILRPATGGGAMCGALLAQRHCKAHSCPFDCVVSATWGGWGACTRSCAGGKRFRSRYVEAPAQYGGAACPALRASATCNMHGCPIDCVMRTGAWSSCSQTCGIAFQTASVSIEMQNANGGRPCSLSSAVRRCSQLRPCPMDCIADKWGSWTLCSRSCDGGVRHRERQQIRAAAHGGVACGTLKQHAKCNAQACPADCTWGAFSTTWSACTVTCGAGTQRSTRIVKSPASHGGKSCFGPSARQRSCGLGKCAVHCVVSSYGPWSACPRSCGRPAGTQRRYRSIVTEPRWGGNPCPSQVDSRPCQHVECPVDCALGSWGIWSPCSVSCGTGVRRSVRAIVRQARHGGRACDAAAPLARSLSCLLPECGVDCLLARWGAWGACSTTCGIGVRRRWRATARAPTQGGKPCGVTQQAAACPPQRACPKACPDEWLPWRACSVTCGGGVMLRYAVTVRVGCEDKQQRVCNTQPCPTAVPTISPTAAPTRAPTPISQVRPILRIIGDDILTVEASRTQPYDDAGAHCISPLYGNVGGVNVTGAASVDRTKLGAYLVHYDCCSRGVCARRITRAVRVVDTSCPWCELKPGPSTVEARFAYRDPGVICHDARDGVCVPVGRSGAKPLSRNACTVRTISTVDVQRLGTYTVTYRAQDSFGNWNDGACLGSRTYVRTVRVVDTLKPVIALRYGGQLFSVGGAADTGVSGEPNPAARHYSSRPAIMASNVLMARRVPTAVASTFDAIVVQYLCAALGAATLAVALARRRWRQQPSAPSAPLVQV